MKNLILSVFMFASLAFHAQEAIKSKPLKLKYVVPAGWKVTETGAKGSWDEKGNDLCQCSSLHFTKDSKGGLLNVLIYPSDASGLDSLKRNRVGRLEFVDVEKYDKTRNKNFSFEKRKSNFTNIKMKSKSFEVIKYKTKVDDHFYIIYTWQENLGMMSPDTEKELFEVVNGLEPL